MPTATGQRAVCLLALMVASALCAFAQDKPDSVLRPPKGAQVAIVVFEDLECPSCSRTLPLLEQASKTYKIPLVRHDYPIPTHNWSTQAAIMARYFDTHSSALGDEFRDYIFSNQIKITPFNLRNYADKFAGDHKVALPFVIDQDNKLAAAVKADSDIGKAIPIKHTPTVYIVSSKNPKRPYVEVEKPASELYARIDEMMKQ
jgi:protein-disulfide isomerase